MNDPARSRLQNSAGARSATPRRAVPKLLALALSAGFLVASAADARAEFLLQPGDVVRLSIAGLPNATTENTVTIDGHLNLPWLGRVTAAGRTLPDVLESVQDLAVERVIKQYSHEGDLSLIQLGPEDVFIDIAEYRPVVVSGDVSQPGEVPFRLGMTVRDAIALRGGAANALTANGQINDPLTALRWQNEYSATALEHALQLIRLWRINAEIDGNYDAPPPERSRTAVSAEVFEDLVADQRHLMQIRQRNEAGQRDFLDKSLQQTRQRYAILTRQQENLATALSADEEEERRAVDLMERGLAPATRVADIRRSTVLAATRLLDVEDNLNRADLEITRFSRLREEYEEDRMTELLSERVQTQDQVLTLQLRLETLARNLTGSTGMLSGSDVLPAMKVQAVAYRREDGVVVPVEVTLDSDVYPGDTLEITVIPDENGGLQLPRG